MLCRVDDWRELTAAQFAAYVERLPLYPGAVRHALQVKLSAFEGGGRESPVTSAGVVRVSEAALLADLGAEWVEHVRG